MSSWNRIEVNVILAGWTRRLAWDELGAWLAVMCAMRQVGHGGICKIADLVDLIECNNRPDAIALIRRVIKQSEGHWEASGDTITIHNWRKYQLDNTGAERQARYRALRLKPVTQVTPVTTTERERERETEQTEPQELPPDPPPYEKIRTAWNAEAVKLNLPQCKEMTDKRKMTIRQRWSNETWRTSWQAALSRIGKSAFLRGMKEGCQWRANMDWFLRPDSVTKILEGIYDGGFKPPPSSEAAKFSTRAKEEEHYRAQRENAEKRKLEEEKRNAAPPEALATALAKVQEVLRQSPPPEERAGQ